VHHVAKIPVGTEGQSVVSYPSGPVENYEVSARVTSEHFCQRMCVK